MSRRRIALALSPVVLLAFAWAHVASAGTARSQAGRSTTTTTTPIADTTALRALVPHSDECSDVVEPVPIVRCDLGAVQVEYHLVGAHATLDEYRREAGIRDVTGGRGPAACATGRGEERSWSRPSTPSEVAGRYRCAISAGRAELWWSDDGRGLVAHAERTDDADLAALFTWWQGTAAA